MQKWFFCHIPKTGGTSLRKVLESCFEKWQTIPDDYMLKRNNANYPPIDFCAYVLARQPGSVVFFRGHYHISCHKLLGPDTSKIVVLRDPVARYVSLVRRTLGNGGLERQALEALLEEGRIPLPDNGMTRYLGGDIVLDHPDLSRSPVLADLKRQHARLVNAPIIQPDDRLASAKRAIDACEFVGITENMGPLLDRLSSALNRKLDARRDNVGSLDLTLTPRQMDVIEHHHALDRELYRYAVEVSQA